MASLVMTALQWTEKRGRKALGVSLSLGVLTNEPEGLENSSLVGIDFFFFPFCFNRCT